MSNKYSFDIFNKKTNIEYLYTSINISNIENYLKSIEDLENAKNDLKILFIQNNNIYDEQHLLWSVFIAKNRFVDNINISKNLQTEVLLLLSLTDQINKIDSCFELGLGKRDYFVVFVYEEKIDIDKIIKKLNLKEKEIVYNKEDAKNYYKIKENISNKIIEKISSL